jgi:hypothetical protein
MLKFQSSPLRFPQDTLRFLYWVFFKPITLHNYIHKIDPLISSIDDPSLFILWRRRKEHPEFIPIIQLGLLNIFVISWLAFPLTWVFQLAGFEVDWFRVAFGVAGGVAGGVAFGVAVSVAGGVAGGVA